MEISGNSKFGAVIFLVFSIILTIMGISDSITDSKASNMDLSQMDISHFREGDIINGTFSESIGLAAVITENYNLLDIILTKEFSYERYCYVIPYFENKGDVLPTKIILFSTGNTTLVHNLDELTKQTVEWYFNDGDAPEATVRIDRAEVVGMSDEEHEKFLSYITRYVDSVYANMDQEELQSVKERYIERMVPFVVRYNARKGSYTLTLGIFFLSVFIIALIIYLISNYIKKKKLF